MDTERKSVFDLLSLPQKTEELTQELRRLNDFLEPLVAFLQSPQFAQLLETWQDSNILLGSILGTPVTYKKGGKEEN